MRTMKIQLRDIDLNRDQTPLDVVIRADSEGIAICPKGYGDACSCKGGGMPVFLQLYDGQLMLSVWSDINKEDPTHDISLEGAKES